MIRSYIWFKKDDEGEKMSVSDKRLKKKSEEYFDRIAEENYIIKEPQRCYPFVCDIIKPSSGRLLDIGCGEGVLLGKINEELKGRFELFGVDLSLNAIDKARGQLPDTVTLKQGDSEHLPFGDELFDVVVCTHSFHHYPKPDKSVAEMFRCIKRGGLLVVVENYRKELPRRIRNLAYVILRHPRGDIRFYSQEEIRRLLKNASFHEIKDTLITKKSFMITGIK